MTEEVINAFKDYTPLGKTTTFKRFKSPIETVIEGYEGVKKEMEDKGLINDQTTFEEMDDYAGKHVLITEKKE